MLVEDVQYEYNSSIPAAGSMYVGSTYHTIQTHSRIDTDTDTLIKYSTVLLYIHIFFDVCTVLCYSFRIISYEASSASFIHHHHSFIIIICFPLGDVNFLCLFIIGSARSAYLFGTCLWSPKWEKTRMKASSSILDSQNRNMHHPFFGWCMMHDAWIMHASN